MHASYEAQKDFKVFFTKTGLKPAADILTLHFLRFCFPKDIAVFPPSEKSTQNFLTKPSSLRFIVKKYTSGQRNHFPFTLFLPLLPS